MWKYRHSVKDNPKSRYNRSLFIHKTICCLRRNWSFFEFCDFPR